jgi:hypothetical protein
MDRVAIRVEPNDRYNQKAGREDQFLSDNDVILNNLERRSRNILHGSSPGGLGDLE